LEAGLGLFLQAHGAIVKRVSPERAPLVIGRRLWSNRHPAPPPEAGNGPPPSPPTSDANDGAAVWTSERVCRCLEHAVCRTAALLRRSRWLGRLGNAVLTWERPDAKPPVCRRLVFRNGRVVARKDLRSPVVPKPAPLPPVPFHWHPHDKITYDRLRVATTELRRLVQERRPITIQPRPVADRPARQAPRRGVLNRAQLARLLSWF
jgi:hypothetical protein